MAFTCSTAMNHTQIHGVPSRDGLCSVQEMYSFHPLRLLLSRDRTFKQRQRITLRAATGESVGDKSTESLGNGNASEKSNSSGSQSRGASSPFVGAKISSQIAARSGTINSTNKAPTKTATPPPKTQVFQKSSAPRSPFSGADNLTGSKPSGVETLKSSRPSVFLDSKAFMKPASKNLLNALQQSDIDGGKTTKFGQPIVPTNLFDEPKRLPNDDKKFEFSLNTGQLVLIFSFLTIIGIMLGTAFLVWKVGAIHYNEY